MLDLYCKIYIDTALSEEVLVQKIVNFTQGDVYMRTVETDLMDIAIISSEDHNSELKHEVAGFIYYPYYLEIDPTTKAEENSNSFITAISELLIFLKTFSEDIVPSCDYEQELPFRKIFS